MFPVRLVNDGVPRAGAVGVVAEAPEAVAAGDGGSDDLVNAIAPGPTQVERTAHGPAQTQAFLSRLAIKRYATPADVARAALFLVSDQNDYITGHVLNVDGGFGAAGVMYDPAKSGQ